MKMALTAAVLSAIIAVTAYAGDTVAFSFKTIDGKTVEFMPGSTAMVVNVGSHWWPQCKNEAPELQKAYQAYKDKGVRFIGVFAMSSDDDIKKFAETYKITFPVGRENGIAGPLGVQVIPVTVFIGKDGRIAKRYMGAITYDELDANIKTILK